MCCCGKPTINGEPGAYSWDGKNFMTFTPLAPTLGERDALLYDEAGRCGGLDCHSHHFRLVRENGVYRTLLVRHGGGEERIRLSSVAEGMLPFLDGMGSNGRFWLFHTIYSAHYDAQKAAREATDATWRKAAAERRIKTRKLPRRGVVKVWIEPAQTGSAVA